MELEMLQLIGNLGALFIVVVYVALVLVGIGLPFVVFSAARNVRKMRQQLERLNDTLERWPHPNAEGLRWDRQRAAAEAEYQKRDARPGALGI